MEEDEDLRFEVSEDAYPSFMLFLTSQATEDSFENPSFS